LPGKFIIQEGKIKGRLITAMERYKGKHRQEKETEPGKRWLCEEKITPPGKGTKPVRI
jgi:hypothetical protein